MVGVQRKNNLARYVQGAGGRMSQKIRDCAIALAAIIGAFTLAKFAPEKIKADDRVAAAIDRMTKTYKDCYPCRLR